MDKETVKKIIDSPPEYDESGQDMYFSMLRDFISKQMRWWAIGWTASFFIFLIPIIISMIQFFRTDLVQHQVMYATIFVTCCLGIGFTKIYALVVLQVLGMKREMKRLEFRIAELSEAVKDK